MTIYAQLAGTPSYTDFPVVNLGGSDIAAGSPLAVDSSVAISVSNFAGGVGVKTPASSGDAVFAVALETLVAGKAGKARFAGPVAVVTASSGGGITAGTFVEASSTAGYVLTQTSGKATIGLALTTAAASEQLLIMLAVANNA